jgi:hypothetical protein
MKVIKRSGRGYCQDPTKFLNFSRFEKFGGRNVALVEAAFEESAGWEQFNFRANELDEIRSMNLVRLEFEEPNKFFLGDRQEKYDADFCKIFTLCPYTAKYLNETQGNSKRVPIFFPFNEDYIPKKEEKIFDIIYTGHVVSTKILKDLEIISRFNYKFVSNSKHELVTDLSVDYAGKMSLISKSKITLVHNLLYPTLRHIRNVWKYADWRNNSAFSELPSLINIYKYFISSEKMVVPQLKSRVFEAAFGRSLILCKKDPFNVIEKYFIPDKEFLYYEEGGLENTIQLIINNYEKYSHIAERAYERAIVEYTTEAFFNKYLKDL